MRMFEARSSLFEGCCVSPARFLLPAEGADLAKWSVIACDQFTSEPAYWEEASRLRAGSPTMLDLIYPEAWLDRGDSRTGEITSAMCVYARDVLTRAVDGMILIERETTDGPRIGLLCAADLEEYEYGADSRSAIRPTEQTVAERVPPRVRIRRDAILEAGHVLLLADDPADTLIGPLYAKRDTLPSVYDVELLQGGGHLRGWQVGEEELPSVRAALDSLVEAGNGLSLAVGDGNHSLAAARACWQEIRETLTEEQRLCHPARYAMVEINNLHAPSMVFHPVHRVLYGADEGLEAYLVREMGLIPCDEADMDMALNEKPVRIAEKTNPLPVAMLQPVLDAYLREHPGVRIDYIHGDDSLRALMERGGYAVRLKAMEKSDLFPSVRISPLPRKTFSMGEARDKRYYMETRRIRPEDGEAKKG